MQARAGNLDDEASIKITEHFQKIYEQSRGLDSVDSAAALDKEAAGLLQQSSARGVLSNSDALNMKEDSERRESYVKYAGTRSASSRSSWPQSHNSLAKVTDERGVLSRALDAGTSGTQLTHSQLELWDFTCGRERSELIGRKSERRLSAADDLHGSDTQFAHRPSQIPFTCCGTMAYPRRTRGRAEW